MKNFFSYRDIKKKINTLYSLEKPSVDSIYNTEISETRVTIANLINSQKMSTKRTDDLITFYPKTPIPSP